MLPSVAKSSNEMGLFRQFFREKKVSKLMSRFALELQTIYMVDSW